MVPGMMHRGQGAGPDDFGNFDLTRRPKHRNIFNALKIGRKRERSLARS
jgi:hypothetical protein